MKSYILLFIVLSLLVKESIQIDDTATHWLEKPETGYTINVPRYKYVTYINVLQWSSQKAMLASIGGPGAKETPYNVFLLAFWLETGVVDALIPWVQAEKYFSEYGSNKKEIQQNILKKYHDAGKLLMLSAFGATSHPTGYDPDELCTKMANLAKENQLDGIDLDYEDNGAFEGGTGEAWIIKCTKAIRKVLPVGQYILTHAPQGPYFSTTRYPKGAYNTVHKEVGDLIDWYNIQFYNQGDCTYDTYDSLCIKSKQWFLGTAVDQIASNGVEPSKIVVGKPPTQADAYNTGYVPGKKLAEIFAEGLKKGTCANGGVMTWQYKSDLNGDFVRPSYEVLSGN